MLIDFGTIDWTPFLVTHMTLMVIAGFCVILCLLLSVFLILNHLLHYTCPDLQRPMIRIIFMVPVYAIMSFASLIWIDYSLYFELIRDCYEAYILYQFFILLVNYINFRFDDKRFNLDDAVEIVFNERSPLKKVFKSKMDIESRSAVEVTYHPLDFSTAASPSASHSTT